MTAECLRMFWGRWRKEMTHFLSDILRQPDEFERTIADLNAAGQPALNQAAAAIRGSSYIYLTGIGASWHAAMCAGAMFALCGRPVCLQDTAEMLHFTAIPAGAVIIAISRSGRSVEIVNLLGKARKAGAIVVGITNAQDGPLAREADIPIVISTTADYGISVNTYSTLALAAGALATAAVRGFDATLVASLSRSFANTRQALDRWQDQTVTSTWLAPAGVYYFLGRGSSLGSCHEARLLWEEGVKSAATAMGTGNFRHGPQEIVRLGTHVGMWIDGREMREQDLAVAQDLRRMGASVMLIGQDLPGDGGDLVFQLPEVLPEWQFVLEILPAQLAAEHLARLSGISCDSFRFCPPVVESEHGLLQKEIEAAKLESRF